MLYLHTHFTWNLRILVAFSLHLIVFIFLLFVCLLSATRNGDRSAGSGTGYGTVAGSGGWALVGTQIQMFVLAQKRLRGDEIDDYYPMS